MLQKRVPLLWAFAGGCLSSAVILGLWQAEAERNHTATTSAVDARAAFLASLNRLNSFSAVERTAEGAAPEADPAPALPGVSLAGVSPDSTGDSRPSTRTADAADAALTNAASSSVAEVLARLEADYRRKSAVVESREVVLSSSRASSEPGGADAAGAGQQRAAGPLQAPELASSTPPAAPPAVEQAPLPGPAPVLPSNSVPSNPVASNQRQAEVHSVTPPRPEAEVALASRDSGRERVVYMGDVQHNIYVGDVHQGNLYQVQQLAALQQQLAMIQYMQLLTLSSRFAPALPPLPPSRPTAPVNNRHVSAFPSSITNTDNPWGFDFPPTVLVR